MVIDSSRSIWDVVREGNAALLRSRVAAGQSLRIVDEDGWNLTTVSVKDRYKRRLYSVASDIVVCGPKAERFNSSPFASNSGH